MKKVIIIVALALFVSALCLPAFAAQKDSSNFLKEGLLGAGAGAVGGLASGAKGGDVWKGALAGAGVNLVGGMLLDNISGEQVESQNSVNNMDSTNAYKEGYQDGFQNGYKQGYTEGIKEGIKNQ